MYRGIEYDPTQGRSSTYDRVSSSREPITLTYRGSSYELDLNHPAQPSAPRRPYQLMYRGNRYWVGGMGADQPVVSKPRTIADLAAIHHANLQRNLQHRIDVARQKGDSTLLSLLEAERNQIA
jgi:hypothetical protein